MVVSMKVFKTNTWTCHGVLHNPQKTQQHKIYAYQQIPGNFHCTIQGLPVYFLESSAWVNTSMLILNISAYACQTGTVITSFCCWCHSGFITGSCCSNSNITNTNIPFIIMLKLTSSKPQRQCVIGLLE